MGDKRNTQRPAKSRGLGKKWTQKGFGILHVEKGCRTNIRNLQGIHKGKVSIK